MACYFEIIIYFLYNTSKSSLKAYGQGLSSTKKHHVTPSFLSFFYKNDSKISNFFVRIYTQYPMYEHDSFFMNFIAN